MTTEPLQLSPLRYRARAVVDGKVVAESTAAVRLDLTDVAPQLYFPATDVHGDLAGEEITTEGAGELAGLVAFDQAVAQIEIIDARSDDAERDVTVKRFPNWGDVTDLVGLLDVQLDDDGRYTPGGRSQGRAAGAEASQLLGQAVVAAGRHTPGRRAVFASMAFPRAGGASMPVSIELEEVSKGKTFSTFAARGVQSGRTCAVGTLMLDSMAPDLLRHGPPAPDVVGPYDATPYDMSVTGRDLRIVDNAYTSDPDAPVGPAVLDVWVRLHDIPDDAALHAGLLAQFTGHMSIAASMRPHVGIGQSQAHVSISTAINAITLSIHSDVHVDRWLLYHHESTFAGDGMTHSECRVFDEQGGLVASFTVEAMVRGFANPATGNAKTAL